MSKSPMVARINSLIAAKGISKQEFYKNCNITSATLSQWNTGKTQPRGRTLKVIAEFLGTTVEYLLSGDEREDAQQGTKKDPAQMGEVDAELVEIWNSADAADRRFLLETARMLKARRESK